MSGPMGGAFSGGAAVGDAPGAVTYPVVLNVYDLTPINNYLHWCGLGIFHSAVEGERQVRNGNSSRWGLFDSGKNGPLGRAVLLNLQLVAIILEVMLLFHEKVSSF